MPLSKAVKFVLRTLLKREIDKKARSLYLFLGIESDSDRHIQEIKEKLDQIKSTLDRMEKTLNASVIRSLMSGYLHLKNAEKLSSDVRREQLLMKAYTDFQDMVSIPMTDNGSLEISKAKSLAYFGGASALSALNETPELIAKSVEQGFLQSPTIAKSFMSKDVWHELAQKCYAGNGIAELVLLIDQAFFSRKFADSCEIAVSVAINQERNIAEREFSLVADNLNQGSRKVIAIEAGLYEVKVEASVTHINSYMDQPYPSTVTWSPNVIFYSIQGSSGIHSKFDIKVNLEKGGFWEKSSSFTTVTKRSEKAIDCQSREFKDLIEPLLK